MGFFRLITIAFGIFCAMFLFVTCPLLVLAIIILEIYLRYKKKKMKDDAKKNLTLEDNKNE